MHTSQHLGARLSRSFALPTGRGTTPYREGEAPAEPPSGAAGAVLGLALPYQAWHLHARWQEWRGRGSNLLVMTRHLLLLLGVGALSLIREDAAIAAAAGLVLLGKATWPSAACTVVAGVLAGDIGLYAAGRLAGRSAWVTRRVSEEKLQCAKDALERSFPLAMLASRVVPGVLFPTYVACGATAVPFGRFLRYTVATAVVWALLLMLLLTAFGKAAALYASAALALAAVVLTLVLAREHLLKALGCLRERLRRVEAPGEPEA